MADEEEDKFGYYRDHFTWSMRQAEALRKRDLDAIDWENVSEKIEDFGKGEWLDCLVSSRCRPFAEFSSVAGANAPAFVERARRGEIGWWRSGCRRSERRQASQDA